MTCGHRGVCGENDLARHTRRCFVKTQAFVCHAVANCFKHHEGAMSLIEVQHAGSNTHRLEGPETADTQKQFLPNSDASVSRRTAAK